MASIHALAVIIAATLAGLLFCSIHIDAAKVWNDVENCGQYKLKCPKAPAHSDRTCKSAKCGYKCKGSWRDCDYSKSNGCETNVEVDARNCGKCGEKCPVPKNSIATCSQGGKCGFQCKKPWRDCDNRKQNGCEANVECDPRNCGQCGKACPVPANSIATCSKGGKCDFKCKSGFKLSNSTCVASATISTCSTCTAPDSHTNAVCKAGRCEYVCHEGFRNCDADAGGSCEVNLKEDPNNCGSCRNVCPGPSSDPRRRLLSGGADFAVCTNGTCGIICGAPDSYADCDESRSNGCETRIDSDPNHCGKCNKKCPDSNLPNTSGLACILGECGFSGCKSGFENCDKLPGNGCEVNVNTDEKNCGSCGKVCSSLPNTIDGVCIDGTCKITKCVEGFWDCDGESSNGCEVNLRFDESSCANCTQVCPTWAASAHVTACLWENDQCVTYGCEEEFSDCDLDIRNGCESASFTVSSGCRSCSADGAVNLPCPVRANTKAAKCVGSYNQHCGYTECLDGFADCDSEFSNGCETDLSSEDQLLVREFCGTCVTDSDCVISPFTRCTNVFGSVLCLPDRSMINP